MSADIRVLRTERHECRESVIETLNEALRQAVEDDDVVAVGICVVRPSGAINSAFSDSDDCARLLGAAELLKQRIFRALDE